MKDQTNYLGITLFKSLLDEISTAEEPIPHLQKDLDYAYRILTDEIFHLIIQHPRALVKALYPYLKEVNKLKRYNNKLIIRLICGLQKPKRMNEFLFSYHCGMAHLIFEKLEIIAEFILKFKSVPKGGIW